MNLLRGNTSKQIRISYFLTIPHDPHQGCTALNCCPHIFICLLRITLSAILNMFLFTAAQKPMSDYVIIWNDMNSISYLLWFSFGWIETSKRMQHTISWDSKGRLMSILKPLLLATPWCGSISPVDTFNPILSTIRHVLSSRPCPFAEFFKSDP